MQSNHPHPCSYGFPATKQCRKCGNAKTLPFFPRDRSRPDGRWHTCKACNAKDWRDRGKQLATQCRWQRRCRHTLTGLSGLRRYRNRNGDRFSSLPPELRWKAERLLAKYVARHSWHMTDTRYAALIACAASNVRRLGDKSWGRSLRRHAGYRRAEGRKAAEEAALTAILAKTAGKSRVAYLPLD